MELNEFIEKFCEELEIENVSEINAETEFHMLDEWSSLAALTVIAMVDENFDVQLNGNDIRESETIQDLFDLINSKQVK